MRQGKRLDLAKCSCGLSAHSGGSWWPEWRKVFHGHHGSCRYNWKERIESKSHAQSTNWLIDLLLIPESCTVRHSTMHPSMAQHAWRCRISTRSVVYQCGLQMKTNFCEYFPSTAISNSHSMTQMPGPCCQPWDSGSCRQDHKDWGSGERDCNLGIWS